MQYVFERMCIVHEAMDGMVCFFIYIIMYKEIYKRGYTY